MHLLCNTLKASELSDTYIVGVRKGLGNAELLKATTHGSTL